MNETDRRRRRPDRPGRTPRRHGADAAASCAGSACSTKIRDRPGLAGAELRDAGDLEIEPGFLVDDDPRAKNRRAICEFLPRERDLVAATIAEAGRQARLLVLGGDCTAHAGALAGLRAAWPDRRLALAWFDAHGDFNTPDTTPSGNVWGMPFAMICGRGDADLVAACDGPSVREDDAALLGGQVLDETESRMLAASRVAHFGAGMLGTDAGLAAVDGWARTVATRVDGLYVAVDMDCLDASGDWAVTMPEPGGLALETARTAIDVLGRAIPVARLWSDRDHRGQRRREANRRRRGGPGGGSPRLAGDAPRAPR